ncbi:MAG: putative metallo-hydrolase YycJ [Phycisphaerae bacterium]|nr:putative metallo-hydrolase YycJ [Phycisphaerae bacterium]
MGIVTFSLQSGSNGNSIYVQTPDARLLFDAGISGRQAERRMARHSRDLRDCDALILSHGHVDHVRCAGVFHRKFNLPVLTTRAAWDAAARFQGAVDGPEFFAPGQTLRFGGTTVETIPTPHDALDSVAFVVACNGSRLGILTDLGHVFDGLADLLDGLDAAYLETNYDPDMLWNGTYPWPLKQRISGGAGHLSNDESGSLAGGSGRRLRWVAAAHLSEENNSPAKALAAMKAGLGRSLPVMLAGRYDVSDAWDV